MRTIKCFFLLFILVFPISAAWARPAQQVREIPLLMRERTNPKGEILPPGCFNDQLMSYFQDKLKATFRPQFYPFKRAQLLTAEGKGLFWGMPKMSPEEDPENRFQYSDTVYVSNVWLVVRKDSPITFAKISDLQGLTLSTFYGVRYSPAFEQARGKVFQVEEEPDSINNRMRKLQMGRGDILLLHSRATSAAEVMGLSKTSMPELENLKILPKPIDQLEVRFVIGKQAVKNMEPWSRNLLAHLNRAIREGARTGALKKIVHDTLSCN